MTTIAFNDISRASLIQPYTSKFSKAILANDIIKAASLITDQRDRDYVFSQINITEDKVRELGKRYNPEIGEILERGIGYWWRSIYDPNFKPSDLTNYVMLAPNIIGNFELFSRRLIVDAYLQHAREFINRIAPHVLKRIFYFILAHSDRSQFKDIDKLIKKVFIAYPNVFYDYMRYQVFSTILNRHVKHAIIKHTSPWLIQTRNEGKNNYYTYKNVSLKPYNLLNPLTYEGTNLKYEYRGKDLYVLDPNNNVVGINGLEGFTSDALQVNNPVALIAMLLKDKVEAKYIPDLANILYYISTKSVNNYLNELGIRDLDYEAHKYTAQPISTVEMLQNINNNMLKAMPINDKYIMLCAEIYPVNPSGIYTIDIKDTLLGNEILPYTTITYDTNQSTVILS